MDDYAHHQAAGQACVRLASQDGTAGTTGVNKETAAPRRYSSPWAPTLSPPYAATLAIHHPGGGLFYPFAAAATPHSEKLETRDGY